MSAVLLNLEVRVLRDRVIWRTPGGTWAILGRVLRCPCCGEAAAFAEA